MGPSEDELVQSFRWKLGLPFAGREDRLGQVWRLFVDQADGVENGRNVCRIIAEKMLGKALRHRLGLEPEVPLDGLDAAHFESLLTVFLEWIQEDMTWRSPKLAGAISGAVKSVTRGGTAGIRPSGRVQASDGPPASGHMRSGPLPPLPRPVTTIEAKPAVPGLPVGGQQATTPSSGGTPSMKPPASLWKYVSPPIDEPDPHAEFGERFRTAPEYGSIIGARVRGRKHKHEGTHCDDWFDFATTGDWTLLAVSDGGGSYKFSRVGAKVATETAVRVLSERLAGHRIRERSLANDDNFEGADVAVVRDALVESMGAAAQAIREAADARAGSEQHAKVLGRPLTVRDLHATLLVAVHTTVRRHGVDCSLVIGCSVGDGMIGVIDENGGTSLLMTADSGEHSGETNFLDENSTARAVLKGKIRTFAGPLRAVVVMSDGVADDYFPNDPGLSRLYGDLVLNGILTVRASESEISQALRETNWKSREDIDLTRFQTELAVSPSAPEQTVLLRSMAAFAEGLGLPISEVVKSVPLLAAGSVDEATCAAPTPERRLRVWLDSYHVRGSFDDRTLLILQRLGGP